MKKVKLFNEFAKLVIEGKEEDEAKAILQDLLDEYDPYELVDMMPEDAYETVAAYGHKGKKAEKIATALLSMAQNGEFESKEPVVNEAKFKEGQYIKAKSSSDKFTGDVYDRTNDVDGSEIEKGEEFEIYEIGKDEVILWSDEYGVEYSIDPKDLKYFIKESVVTEVNADGTISDDEDQRREELEMEVYHEAKAFADSVKERAYDIGGSFRGPGIQADVAKQIKRAFKDAKFRL